MDQCVRVEAECCRCEGRAVVERHRQRARAALGTAGCACEESERCVDWSAACVDQRCVVRDPEATALAEAVQEGGATPSEQACETSDQCRVIGRECLGTIAVNRAHYDVVRQRVIDRLSAGIACGGSTGATEPPPEASCVSGRCVVR